MPKLVNRAKMTTATTGTGTLTLGSAVDGYQTFANAGVANSNVVRYTIEDGSAWEIGLGTYSSTGTTLTRGTIESSTGTAINLSGNATVFVTAAAGDLQELVDFADNFVLPTADGSTGQVLTTNGSGTLTFTTITGYTNADVDAHLNTGTAASGEVLSWNGSDYDWIAAPAALTGQTDSASPFETSLGVGAGAVNTGVNNTFVGFEAGNDNTTGTNNVAVGFQALDVNTTGSFNVVVGKGALGSNSIGASNTGVGQNVMFSNTTGNENSAIGEAALYSNTTGVSNTAVGGYALYSNTTANRNTALGYYSFGSNVTGTENVGIGGEAGSSTTGSFNTFAGYQSGRFARATSNSVGLGWRALYGNTATFNSANNVGVGYETGFSLSTGASNFFGGYQAGRAVTTASNNVAIGNGALDAATTGGRNIAIGQDAMGLGVATVALADNIAIGFQASRDITTGSQNIAIGQGSLLFTNTGFQNTAVGVGAGQTVTTGASNTFLGYGAGQSTTTTSNAVCLGWEAGLRSQAANTVAVGQWALRGGVALMTGAGNVGVGRITGQNLTTGDNNSLLGTSAGTGLTTGSTNTLIGAASGTTLTTGANNTVLGYNAQPSSATVSNEITLGNASVTRFRIPGIQAAAANGDVLTFDSANGIIKLQAPAGGGGLTLLSESTISSATSTVTITFPSGYRVYQLVFKNVRQNVDNESIRFQRLDSSGTAITGSTAYFYSSHDTSTTVTSSTGASFWQVNPSGIRPYTTSQAYAGLNFNFVFWGVRESTDYMAGIGEGTYLGASAVANIKLRMSATTAEQNNGIRMQSENGSSFTSGTILLYGVA